MKKSKKNSRVSLTAIRNLLKEVLWNPRKPGPMAIISDVGSAEFYEYRAIEEIREAQSIREIIPQVEFDPTAEYHQRMTTAIRLLLLARTSV